MAISARGPLAFVLALFALFTLTLAQNCAYDKPQTCLIAENATIQYEICERYICDCNWNKNPSCVKNFCEGGPETVGGLPCTNSVLGHFVFKPLVCCQQPQDQIAACLTNFSAGPGSGCGNFHPLGLTVKDVNAMSSFRAPIAAVIGFATLALGFTYYL